MDMQSMYLGCFEGALSANAYVDAEGSVVIDGEDTFVGRVSTFIQYSASACGADDERLPYDDSGHGMCADNIVYKYANAQSEV